MKVNFKKRVLSNGMTILFEERKKLLEEIIDCRMFDIEHFYDNFKNKLDETTIDSLERFIDKMNDEDKTFYNQIMEEVKIILFNFREKLKKSNNPKNIII